MTSAHANLLNNPGFEISAFTSAANVLTNFPGFQGIWGPEVGSITGATAGVTPAAGSNMLRMDDDGLSYTQAFQVVDVSSFGATISTGTAMVNASAFFNTVGGFTGAFSLINVAFLAGRATERFLETPATVCSCSTRTPRLGSLDQSAH